MVTIKEYVISWTRSIDNFLKHHCIRPVSLAVLMTTLLISNFSKIPSIMTRQAVKLDIDQSPEYCIVYDHITCENGGVVDEIKEGYGCKCIDGFYGIRCEKKQIFNLKLWFYTDVNLRAGKPATWWSFLPFTVNRQLKNIYEFHQNNFKELEMHTSDGDNDGWERNMTSTRILPPTHPIECTNVTSVYLTSLADVHSKLVQRDPRGFKLDAKRRNILVDTFYQYFVMQFFDANFNLTVTASQLYGADEATQKVLRLFSNGKLRTEILDDEHYPPKLSLFKRLVKRFYPMNSTLKSLWFNRIMYSSARNAVPDRATGHPMLSTNAMYYAMSTLWIREHNRVCDVLQQEWPEWTDDQLYNTARKVVIGEMMGIMMNDVINARAEHSLSLKFKPEIFHNHLQNISSFSTPFELLLTTMWPSSLPDMFNNVAMKSVFFGSSRQVRKYGITNTVKFMVNQATGTVTRNNYGDATEPTTSLMMRLSRENALQSFNNYRRKLGLYPYKNFYDLTEDYETAEILRELYDKVDDVELLTGMLTEKKKPGVLSTVQVMANSLIVNSILINTLNSEDSWKPETFGGNKGFDIVRSANIESFICNNLVDKCSDGFKVKLFAD